MLERVFARLPDFCILGKPVFQVSKHRSGIGAIAAVGEITIHHRPSFSYLTSPASSRTFQVLGYCRLGYAESRPDFADAHDALLQHFKKLDAIGIG